MFYPVVNYPPQLVVDSLRQLSAITRQQAIAGVDDCPIYSHMFPLKKTDQ